MKALLVAALTAGVLGGALLASPANAQVQIGIGVGNGYGYNHGYGFRPGYGPGYFMHHHHMRQHCFMVKRWRHHHAVWTKQCSWG